MDAVLRENERMDELGRKGYRLIQDTKAFCFGIDAVLLADFAQAAETASCRSSLKPEIKAAR